MERTSCLSRAHLFERDMPGIFMDTLKDPYFDRLVSSGASEFFDLVSIRDWIEKVLKDGKIHINTRESSAQKRFFGIFQKKKEEEANTVMGERKNKAQQHVPAPYHQVASITHVSYP